MNYSHSLRAAGLFSALATGMALAPAAALADPPCTSIAGSPHSTLPERNAQESLDSPELRAVRFRFLVDGQPFSWQEIKWRLQGKGNVWLKAKTDRDGQMWFVDTRDATDMFVLGPPRMKSPADPWFALRFRPTDLDETMTFSLRTGSLTVAIPESWRSRGGWFELWLSPEEAKEGDEPAFWEPLHKLGQGVTFEHLQHGRYFVKVAHLDGSVAVEMAVEVGEQPETLTLPAPVTATFHRQPKEP